MDGKTDVPRDVHYSEGWPRLWPRTRKVIWVSHLGGRTQDLETITALSQASWNRECSRNLNPDILLCDAGVSIILLMMPNTHAC